MLALESVGVEATGEVCNATSVLDSAFSWSCIQVLDNELAINMVAIEKNKQHSSTNATNWEYLPTAFFLWGDDANETSSGVSIEAFVYSFLCMFRGKEVSTSPNQNEQ